ncbi:hypothetical protein BDY19DRAFT_419586 [Irpex rosettiformis]|uniref:Uncharacterized protein n=1 Tax=Irpex rosettiformis TaxID=378272 RepID=A0ACB8UGX3_9APHY|nr:hypothetical protein BDY19DRAFT_419586 [Irpex rosettiformis]
MTRSCTVALARRQLPGSASRSYGTRSQALGGCSLPLSYSTSHYYRLYSTSPPPVDKTTTTSTTSDSSLPLQQQKSRRIELRPGPVKPHITGVAVPTRTATSKTNKALAERATKDSTVPAASGSATSEDGVISSAKHDLEEAAQHGILVPPPPNAGVVARLFHQAKELFKFYYRGLKLINTNRKRANEMKERVKIGGPPLTRWEHRFIRTSEEDMRKLIPFALIILIAEEVIPLVVMYTPFILPSTCILPAQKERIDGKLHAKQQVSAASMRDTFERIYALGKSDAGKDVKHLLDGPGLIAYSGILGHSNYSLDFLRMRKIRKHLSAVAEDDALLIREARGSRLTPSEVTGALSERGIVTEGLSLKQQQARLQWWLTEIQKSQTESQQHDDPIAHHLVLIARDVIGRK